MVGDFLLASAGYSGIIETKTNDFRSSYESKYTGRKQDGRYARAQAAGEHGGGRPDMAQAGGKEPDKLSDALEAGKQAILDLVK